MIAPLERMRTLNQEQFEGLFRDRRLTNRHLAYGIERRVTEIQHRAKLSAMDAERHAEMKRRPAAAATWLPVKPDPPEPMWLYY